jgi:uncharacterized protein (TIGR02145 family)
MKNIKTIVFSSGVFILLFSYGSISFNNELPGIISPDQTGMQSKQTDVQSQQKSTQTQKKSTQSQQAAKKPQQTTSKSKKPVTKPKPTTTKAVPVKPKDPSVVMIGTQAWAIANLNVMTFRNGDTIPEARTNKEWVDAGAAKRPAWCYYNNDPAMGQKYGRLYNWYAVNDPRELAPAGWSLSTDEDWARLTYYLTGKEAAGIKLKSTTGWKDGDNGTNESGFTGLPGGYRVENGMFKNLGSTGIWWSATDYNSISAYDHYLFMGGSLGRSYSPKQRGESVRCIKK